MIVRQYLKQLSDVRVDSNSIVDFFLTAKEQAVFNLRDGSNQKPHYSLRTLCRALSQAQAIYATYGSQRALYEGFCMSFLTQLDARSHAVIYTLLKKVFAISPSLMTLPKQPSDKHVEVCGFWLRTGPLAPEVPQDYIMTPSIIENLLNVARIVVSHKYPVLLQGPTSSGKTSLIEYMV